MGWGFGIENDGDEIRLARDGRRKTISRRFWLDNVLLEAVVKRVEWK